MPFEPPLADPTIQDFILSGRGVEVPRIALADERNGKRPEIGAGFKDAAGGFDALDAI